MSETINLGRGCRQGDPISPYLFVLAVELLGETFRKHTKLRGISVHGREHRISQFADDTTLFMKYNESNLRECISILNNFFQISGLKINVEKTKAIKFGVTGDSRMILCKDLNLIWTHEFASLGIDYNIQNLNLITELNLESKILEIEKLSFIWNSGNLTLIGKITIIKTFMISKIIHILLSLPRLTEETFIRIEQKKFKFLWLNKPPKFKIPTVENLTASGGLQFPNIRKIYMIMKASWVKRIYKSDNGWAATPIFYGLNKIYEYGDIFLERKSNIRNLFWKNAIQSVYYVYTNARIGSLEQVLSIPLWYNSQMISGKIQGWIDKGIHTVGDLIHTEGHIVSLDYMKNTLQLGCDFLLYNRLKYRLKILGNNQISIQNNIHPRLPYML